MSFSADRNFAVKPFSNRASRPLSCRASRAVRLGGYGIAVLLGRLSAFRGKNWGSGLGAAGSGLGLPVINSSTFAVPAAVAAWK